MATPVVDSSTPGEVAVPWRVKLVGSVLNVMDWMVYRKDGTVNRTLQGYLSSTVPASSTPVNGTCSKDVVIDAVNNVWVRLFIPVKEKTENDGSGGNSDKALPVIIFYHGGGFVGLSADLTVYDKLCRNAAKACSAVVVSVNYRLAPEFPYPAAHDDCYKAFEWLRSPDSRNDLPATADLSQCFLFGDSAGANLVHYMGCRAAENDISPLKLRGMVELQPFFGGEELTPAEINLKPPVLPLTTCLWSLRAYVPGGNRDHHAINVFGPNAMDISGLSLPPILVVIGSLDILQDRQASYVKKLQDLGKDVTVLKYNGACHAFYGLFSDSTQQKAMADTYDFIRARTNV